MGLLSHVSEQVDAVASDWVRSLSGVQAVAGVAQVLDVQHLQGRALSSGEVPRGMADIICEWAWACEEALAVVYGPTLPNADAPDGCPTGESGGSAMAFNAGNIGLMQINAASHMDKLYAVTGTYDVALLFDPVVNVAVGWLVYVAANETWAPWSCRPGGYP